MKLDQFKNSQVRVSTSLESSTGRRARTLRPKSLKKSRPAVTTAHERSSFKPLPRGNPVDLVAADAQKTLLLVEQLSRPVRRLLPSFCSGNYVLNVLLCAGGKPLAVLRTSPPVAADQSHRPRAAIPVDWNAGKPIRLPIKT
jgi:hypothetical protein